MNKIPVLLLGICLILFSCSGKKKTRQIIDLSGEWSFSLDPDNNGLSEKWETNTFADIVRLPGTTDENRKGIKNADTNQTTHLSREYTWFGKAWYQKKVSIPGNWKNRKISLVMERTKPTTLWIDDILVGSNTDITASQVYDLSSFLKPGEHRITVMVDNGRSVPREVIQASHAYVEHTQTNWNGIIGKFYIEACNLSYIADIQTYPDVESHSVKVVITIENNTAREAKINFNFDVWNTITKRNPIQKSFPVSLKQGGNIFEYTIDLGSDALLWDEFNPNMYRLSATLNGGKGAKDELVSNFGLRKFATRGTQFIINDNVTFLRGKHDACVFPLIGHAPMDVESWKNYFGICKTWGINHIRFHSWCPPEAAFEAADIVGLYLQPELPFWGNEDPRKTELIEFLKKEGVNIQKNYSNHASFVMLALGNELSGSQIVMNDFITAFRTGETRHLFAYGSNNYLGFQGHVDGEDYLTTCRIGKETPNTFDSHVRASFSFADAYDGGYINGSYPNTIMNYSGAITKSPVPVISHETGQFQVYPDYDQLSKYTGVLKPWNLEVFKKRLENAGMGNQGKDFSGASGALSALCYKADIEMGLRTKGFGGFQLLDLQDFPGQGTALVGMLDAFMDNKGILQPVQFREFCSEVVPLLIIEKFCWINNEILKAKVKIANYSTRSFIDQIIKWELRKGEKVLKEGKIQKTVPYGELSETGGISIPLADIKDPERLELFLTLEGTAYKNHYPIWIYPEQDKVVPPSDIFISKDLDNNTLKLLKQGAKVLLFPDHKKIESQSVGGLFILDYWNYRMFKGISEGMKKPVSPGTLGILVNPLHPAFELFPTDVYSNWQWWPIVKNSRPLILDSLGSEYRPIVQVIDNIERNHKLGLIFEFNVENGKLLICTSNLPAIQNYPEAKQLYMSILSYMKSDKFQPDRILKKDEILKLLNQKIAKENIKGVKNVSY